MYMSRVLSTVWLILLAAGWMLVAGIQADELEDDHSLVTTFETPHTVWAKPYAGKTMRLLYFTSVPFSGVDYCKARQMVELMQRFDMEAQAVYWAQIADSSQYQWHGDAAGLRRLLELLEQPFDCYFFDRVPLANLSVECQYKLLKAVTEGAGLVFVGAEDQRVMKSEDQLRELPPFLAAAQPAGAFAIRNGRGVNMGSCPDTPYRLGWEVGYDYWQERLGRAILWAANRAPEVDLSVRADPPQLDRASLPGRAITVEWRKANASRSLTFSIHLRSDDGQVVVSVPDQRRDSPEGTLACEVPVLKAGSYHADVRARSERGAEAWATVSFTVASARRIESIELDRDWGEIGEQIPGRVTLAGQPVQGERLQVRLVDSRGRILVKQEWTPSGQLIHFAFPIQAWLPMLVRVEAALLQGDATVSSDYRFAHVVKRHRGQFNFLAWESPTGPLSPYVEEALAKLGVTVQLVWRNPPLEAAANEIAWVPYTTRITSPKDDKGIMQPACWNDEDNINKHVQDVVKAWVPSRQHGVFVYSLGDETVTRGACIHPACLAAYRQYLRSEYKTIAALNASWGASYADFDDVQLSTLEDSDEAQAKRDRNYPRWYDRQAFHSYNFVQFCKRFGDAYRAIDPEARTGFEGAGVFNDGDDYDLIVRTNGFWSPYPGAGDEVIRSLAPRGFPRSNWMGYTKDANSLLAVYYRMIVRGCDAVWWWMFPNIGRFNGLLRPTLEPYPAVKEIVKDTQVLHDGLGTLLIRSEMQDDGIAILYSMPSAYATKVESGPSYGAYEAHHVAWYSIIRGLGLQFRYVTDRMLRLGEFDAKRFKVLILPRIEAIGVEEAKVIRQFVEGGGTVIADLRPGLYDGHCKPLQKGVLDDLFGIARTSASEAVVGKATIAGSLAGKQVSVDWEKATHDPGVKAVQCTPLGKCGEVPLFTVRRVGKGQAVLLNFAVTELPSLSADQTDETAAEFFQQLFASADVRPAVKATGANGQRLRNAEIVRWRNGGTELVGLFRSNGEPEKATLTLPGARYVYDLRRRQCLGRLGSLSTEIIPSRATFFALTPEEVALPKVTLEPKAARRGQVVKVSLSCPGASGARAILVRASRPDKQGEESLRRVVMVDKGGASCWLPIAYNDPAGSWTVSATELFTNRATVVRVTVK